MIRNKRGSGEVRLPAEIGLKSNSPACGCQPAQSRGLLTINADDWGRDRETTDRAHQCVMKGSVTAVSAMVFMDDSERAAELALRNGVNTGLHLNFTAPFSSTCPPRLTEHQAKVSRYLRSSSFARAIFHPGLRDPFEYVVSAQLEEFSRLYGELPRRLDGHHHMHLCANVLFGRLLPPDTSVRRNFSFHAGEKGWFNRQYRKAIDRFLARHHGLTDFFFSLPPLDPRSRITGILSLATRFNVEVETHPVNREEYAFLMGAEMRRLTENVPLAPHAAVLD